jgi:6-phosphogluconolactonase
MKDDQPAGGVSAFAVDPADGRLTFLNRQSSHGAAPCYVSVAPGGQHVLVANYSTGTLAAYPIEAGGTLGPASDVVQHEGQGSCASPSRTSGALHHRQPRGVVLACDLGLDRVFVYRFDGRPKLTPNEVLRPARFGAGRPAFHLGAPFVYVLNEIDSPARLRLGCRARHADRQTVSTLPQFHREQLDGAGSDPTPDCLGRTGARQYRGIRHRPGHGTADNARVAPARAGALSASAVRDVPAGSHQNTHAIVTFRIDPQTGQLTPTVGPQTSPGPGIRDGRAGPVGPTRTPCNGRWPRPPGSAVLTDVSCSR